MNPNSIEVKRCSFLSITCDSNSIHQELKWHQTVRVPFAMQQEPEKKRVDSVIENEQGMTKSYQDIKVQLG